MSWLRRTFARWTHVPPISSRHEIVLALAVASVISGGGGLAHSGLKPVSVAQFVPAPFLQAWYAILILGGVALVVAAFWPDRLDVLLLEGPAWLLLGTGSLVYGVCLVGVGHGTAFVAACGYLGYAVASLVRFARISLFVRWLGRQVDDDDA